jgi:hypothetical protein
MASYIGRRKFLTTVGGAAAAWPLAAGAQQFEKMPRVGVLVSLSAPHPFTEAFRSGMRDLGYIEGRNIAIVGPAKRLHCSPSPGHLQLSSLRRKCPADTIALPELGLAYSPDGTGLTLKTRRCSRFASKRGSVFVLTSLSLSMMA